MKKSDMRELIKNRGDDILLMKIRFRYDGDNRHLIPLTTAEKLFLAAAEKDFQVDGFTVRQYRDIEKVKPMEGKYAEIFKSEHVADGLEEPPIDLTNWQTVTESLYDLDKNFILEKESKNSIKTSLYIGHIEKCYKHFVLFNYFDSEGIWEAQPAKIFHSEIKSITLKSRYIRLYSKYVKPPT